MGSLARLIFERLDVHRWLLKIDDEFGGRGHAVLDAPTLPCHAALLREKARSLQLWVEPAKQQVRPTSPRPLTSPRPMTCPQSGMYKPLYNALITRQCLRNKTSPRLWVEPEVRQEQVHP